MDEQIEVSKHVHKQLKSNSNMLGQIATIVESYCEEHHTTLDGVRFLEAEKNKFKSFSTTEVDKKHITIDQQFLINEIINKDLAEADSDFTIELIKQIVESLSEDMKMGDIALQLGLFSSKRNEKVREAIAILESLD